MANANFVDPGSTEIISPHISGLQEAVAGIQMALGMPTVEETNVTLSEVFISPSDRYRIFQAPAGKRNWVSLPSPVIRKNGIAIDTGFLIEYGGGAIILESNAVETDVFTADFTRIDNSQEDVKADKQDVQGVADALLSHEEEYSTFKGTVAKFKISDVLNDADGEPDGTILFYTGA
jgi:hypothetical protein